MKPLRLILAILATALTLAFAPSAWASCTTHTYYGRGRIITCETCCYYNDCTTTCFGG
jgi:hypothetical protein